MAGLAMKQEEVIRMAREAGESLNKEWLVRFAALVAAAEREACAQIADEVGDDDEDCHAWTAADAIRARGDE